MSLTIPTAAGSGDVTGRLGRCHGRSKLAIIFSACRSVRTIRRTRVRALGRADNACKAFSLVIYSRTRHAAKIGLSSESRDGFAGVRSTSCVGKRGHLCVATAPHLCNRSTGVGTSRGSTVLYSVSSPGLCKRRFFHMGFSCTIRRKLLASCGMLILAIGRGSLPRGILASVGDPRGGRLGFSSASGLVNMVGNLSGVVQNSGGMA